MTQILLLDNIDSFTYNLSHLFARIFKGNIIVKRKDEINIDYVNQNNFDGIIISPGPKTPKESPLSTDIIKTFYKQLPIFSVCLGMQCLNEAFGGKTVKANRPVHGKIAKLKHTNSSIFKDLPQDFTVARYHSLIVENVPPELHILAREDKLLEDFTQKLIEKGELEYDDIVEIFKAHGKERPQDPYI